MARAVFSIGGLVTLIVCLSNFDKVGAVDGRLFFMAFMNTSSADLLSHDGFQQVHISSVKPQPGDIQEGKVKIEYVPLGRVRVITLNVTNNWQFTVNVFEDLSGPTGTKLPASIIVSSEIDISVQANLAEGGSGDGYLVLPITEEAKKFYVASYTPKTPGNGFAIAAPRETCVDVRYHNGPTNYRVMHVNIPKNYAYLSNSSLIDWTGYYVESNRPIALYGGLDCAFIPRREAVTTCDHIVEQMPPHLWWGHYFIMSSFHGSNYAAGYRVRVVAGIRINIEVIKIDATTGTVSPKETYPIGRGQFEEIEIGRGNANPTIAIIKCSFQDDGSITIDSACLVMQYNPGLPLSNNGNTNKPDAFMVTVPALKQYTSDLTFATSSLYVPASNSSLNFENGITIIAKQSAAGRIMLDYTTPITSIPQAQSKDVDDALLTGQGGPFVVIRAPLTPGFHTLTSSDATDMFTAFIYGHAPQSAPTNTGYGYLAGIKVPDNDKPVVSGPWFDFAAPPIVVTVPENGGTPDNATGPIVAEADLPKYEVVWETKFYALDPNKEDLKTRVCSEAYQKYFLEVRFRPMKTKLLNTFIPQQCAGNIKMTMEEDTILYYSEFTDGLIRFKVVMTSTGSATLGEIFDCLGFMSDFISQFQNWRIPEENPNTFNGKLDFLNRTNRAYTKNCDRLYMGLPNFESNYFGWNCATKGGLLGASSGHRVVYSLVTVISTILASFMLKCML